MHSTKTTLFGQTPTRYGLTSLIAACLAYASWSLMAVVGFVMVYVAALLALIAVAAGILGVGTGTYFNEWRAAAAGSLGLVLIGFGLWSVVSALTHF